jgi:3-hydroxybutyryl-CoA dehydrogenase
MKVAVIGAGTMGNGIAHCFAQYGYEVILVDNQTLTLQKALDIIGKNLQRQAGKNIFPESDIPLILNRIKTQTYIDNALQNCDLVVEAVSEKLAIKQQIIQQINAVANPNCIIASNTSSISITLLAQQCSHPQNFIGMHFMNPVPVMQLVEVIKGHHTNNQCVDNIINICKKLQKTPIVVNDYPGFIANRILMPMINEAIYSVYEGVAEVEAVDEIMKLGMAHPMGPLQLADFIGLDVCLSILRVLHEGFGNPKYAPCPLLVNMVNSGSLGKKTGIGFYKY